MLLEQSYLIAIQMSLSHKIIFLKKGKVVDFKYATHLFFLLSVLFQNAICMEQKGTLHHIPTGIQQPHLVAVLAPDKIFIGGSNGFELINPWNNNELIKQESFEGSESKMVYDVAVNKAKTKFAITIDDKAICYNAQTNECEWEYQTGIQKKYNSVIFDPGNDNKVFTYSRFGNDPKNPAIRRIYYIGNKYLTPLCCLPKSLCTMHAFISQESRCYTEIFPYKESYTGIYPDIRNNIKESNAHIVELLYSPHEDFRIIHCAKTGIHVVKIEDEEVGHHAFLETVSRMLHPDRVKPLHSNVLKIPNISGGVRHIEIYNTFLYERYNNNPFFKKNAPYVGMQFYSNDILMLLSKSNILEFWDIKTKELLETLSLQQYAQGALMERQGKRVCNSLDYASIFVALQNSCCMVPVPFNVRYAPGTKEQLLSLFCLLRYSPLTLTGENTTEQNSQCWLPEEVIYIILQKLLACSQRVS